MKIFNRLISDERKLGVDTDEMCFDIDDVYLLMRHIFEWTCFITGKKNLNQYYVTRWDPEQPISLFNSVILGKTAYDQHIAFKTLKAIGYDEHVYERMDAKRRLIQDYKDKKHVNYK